MHPLTIFTRQSVSFRLFDECEKIVQKLKTLLASTLVLTLSQENVDFIIYCDTSRVRLGGVLMQKGIGIAYDSRQLKTYEKNYPIYNLE